LISDNRGEKVSETDMERVRKCCVCYLFNVSVNHVDPVLGNLKTTRESFLNIEIRRESRNKEIMTWNQSLANRKNIFE
jgi:hypothetical protein